MQSLRLKFFLDTIVLLTAITAGSFAADNPTPRITPVRIEAYFAQTFRCPDGQHVIVLQSQPDGQVASSSSLAIRCGEIQLAADGAVVWVNRVVNPDQPVKTYRVTVFLQGRPIAKSDGVTVQAPNDLPNVRVMTFETIGQVFISAETLVEKPGFDLPIYKNALRFQPGITPSAEVTRQAAPQPKSQRAKSATAAVPSVESKAPAQSQSPAESTSELIASASPEQNASEPEAAENEPAEAPSEKETQPIVDQPANDPVIHFMGPVASRRLADGSDVATCSNGIYIYQYRPDEKSLLELRATNAVVFYSQSHLRKKVEDFAQAVDGVYLEGDIVFQLGDYSITADKLYYDFAHQSALVLDGTLKMLVPDSPNMPIFVRAERIRQLSQNRFAAKNLKLSTDEFYQPHVWAGASDADITALDANGEPAKTPKEVKQINYDLRNFTANLDRMPVLWLPKVSGSSANANAPVRAVRTSNSSRYGVGVETEWDLPGMLGQPSPKGLDAVFRADEFSKRGPAVGVDAEYTNPRYFGDMRTYLVHDDGEDRLGNFNARDDIHPPHDYRGQARWRHRQFLPYDWQATFEVGYVSDPYFLESWEEKQFDTEKEPETLVYLKQQRDHWAFDFLTNYHLNDFDYTQTELPSSSFHVAGQDLFRTLTYYQDTSVARMGERAGDRDVPGLDGKLEPWLLPGAIRENEYAFSTTRHELDLPLHFNELNVAPAFIGTYSYDDSMDSPAAGSALQDAAGVRTSTQFWHVDDDAKSRLFDIDRVRHVVIPEASAFWVDSDVEDQPEQDVYNMGVRQRWQTYRGPEGKKVSTDFLRWNNSVTLVTNDVEGAPMPNYFSFSNPEPMFDKGQFLNPDFFNLGLARREVVNQAFSDHTATDWTWLISDMTAVMGGLNYNMTDGDISETDAAIAVQRSPRLSYYVGHQFLKDADTFKDRDMNVLTGGTSYQLNRKYIVAVGEQFDIVRASSSYTQVIIIRKFPHWYGAFSFNVDPLRDEYGISVSFWPEGLDKIALGSRRFSRITP